METKKQISDNKYNKTDKAKACQRRYNKTPKARIRDKKHRETPKRKKYSKEYAQKYTKTEKYKKWQREYSKRKRTNDIQWKISAILRTRLRNALKNNAKIGSAVKNLGCTVPELKIYLESQFKDGMDWDNWEPKGWHIDHKKALSNYNLNDPIQFKEACHYTNLQPMWWQENILKGNKII